MRIQISTSFDRSDLELMHQHEAEKKQEKSAEHRKLAALLKNLHQRIVDEAGKLADARSKMAPLAVKKLKLFLTGLKSRYNELYEKLHGKPYYAAANTQEIPMRVIISMSGSGKMQTEPWAEEMLKVVQKVLPKVKAFDLGSQDGYWTTKANGKKVLAAFKSMKPYEQVDDFWVIESKNDNSVGVSVDFREEMTDDKTKCIIQFYNEDM